MGRLLFILIPLCLGAAVPSVPAPNHPMRLGYYYADGRYGDYTHEVFPFTNLYVAQNRGYVTDSDWRPQFRDSLRRAADANKDIFLLPVSDADWNEVLDLCTPYWSRVRVIEIAHEEDLTIPQAEARAAAINSRLDARGLARKTYGITLTQNQSLSSGEAMHAPSVGLVAIEAYVDPPGHPTSQVNIDGLNSFLDRAKARVPGGREIAIIMMSYDRNGQWTNIPTLADLQMPAYLKAYDDPRVTTLLMFAYARPGGARQHPSLKAVHEQIGAAILGGSPGIDLDAIDQAFITSRWNAPQPNGWFPAVAPQGNAVAYGTGQKWATDLATGQTYFFGDQNYGVGWIRSDTFTYQQEIGGDRSLRFEVRAGEWVARQTSDDPALVAGNDFKAADGVWTSWLARGFRLTIDGQLMQTGVGGALSTGGGWVAHAATNDGTAIRLWRNRQHVADRPARAPLHQMSVHSGYVAYGGYGPVRGLHPDGTDVDLTISPFRWEGSPQVFLVDGAPWVATMTFNPVSNRAYVLLRPFGAGDAIVVHAPAASLSVAAHQGTFTLAYNTDRGALTVLKFPTTARRYALTGPTPPPPPPPPPGELLGTGWEDGQPLGISDHVLYRKDVVGAFNVDGSSPGCARRLNERPRQGSYSLQASGYSRSSYAYAYCKIFDQNIPIQNGTRLRYWAFHSNTAKVSIDGAFTDGSTIRDSGFRDQHGIRFHPGARQEPLGSWHYVEVDLSGAAGKTLDYLMVAFDNGGDGFTGLYITYIDDLSITVEPGAPFVTGWEDGQPLGISDQLLYRKDVVGAFNIDGSSPGCGRRLGERPRQGSFSLQVSGYSRAGYAYAYHRLFDQRILIRPGTKLKYWVFHHNTAKVCIDGVFTDGSTIRDGGFRDQIGVRFHPGARQDPLETWHYVEVDLSAAAGKTLETLMTAFDNGADGFTGLYITYIDDLFIGN
jgi:hypothetical protein